MLHQVTNERHAFTDMWWNKCMKFNYLCCVDIYSFDCIHRICLHLLGVVLFLLDLSWLWVLIKLHQIRQK